MKTKTFLLTLCSVFIIWSCEQDSSLSSLGGNSKLENEIADKALVANSGSTSNSSDILYHIHFDNATSLVMPMHFYLEVLQVVSLVEAGTVIKEQVPSPFPYLQNLLRQQSKL